MTHPLIVELLAALPEPGEELPVDERETWLKTLDMNLSLIYGHRDRPGEPVKDA